MQTSDFYPTTNDYMSPKNNGASKLMMLGHSTGQEGHFRKFMSNLPTSASRQDQKRTRNESRG
jgi:hypothetical protein